MKKISLLFAVVVLSFLSFGKAFADTPLGVTKQVSMAGSGGLDVAAHKCAPLVGTGEWQACVSHHDGLYSLNKDGTISRNYTREAAAPKPHEDGEIVCAAQGFSSKNGQIVWGVQADSACRPVVAVTKEKAEAKAKAVVEAKAKVAAEAKAEAEAKAAAEAKAKAEAEAKAKAVADTEAFAKAIAEAKAEGKAEARVEAVKAKTKAKTKVKIKTK